MRKADNLSPSSAVVTKSGNLNFLEPSGPVRPVMGMIYLYSWSNRTLTSDKCRLSANIVEVIRVIYALPGYYCQYTTQSMTASGNYHDTVFMKELENTKYNTLALVQHLISTEES